MGVAALVAARLGVVWRVPLARGEDQVARLVETLHGASSFKVRLQAAAVLARMQDPRVVAALGRAALIDPSPVVRTQALRLLAKNPGGDASDERARSAIRRALEDGSPQVRAQAARSLADLDQARGQPAGAPSAHKGLVVAVRNMGDRTGRSSPGLRERMKTAVMNNLRREPNVSVSAELGQGASFVVDGVIARFDHSTRGTDVEIVCAVELIVSRPPRGMVLIASGQATVQKPRAYYRPAQREPMEAEALDSAVKGAHESLARFLTSVR